MFDLTTLLEVGRWFVCVCVCSSHPPEDGLEGKPVVGKARQIYDQLKEKHGLQHMSQAEYRQPLGLPSLRAGFAMSTASFCGAKSFPCYESCIRFATRYSNSCRTKFGATWGTGLTPREIEGLDLLYHTLTVFWKHSASRNWMKLEHRIEGKRSVLPLIGWVWFTFTPQVPS